MDLIQSPVDKHYIMDIHSPCQAREGVERRPCQRKEEGRLDRGEWDVLGWGVYVMPGNEKPYSGWRTNTLSALI